VRLIFLETAPSNADTLSASPSELADAIIGCIGLGDVIKRATYSVGKLVVDEGR
jgi:hypothetical protein